MSKPTNRHPAKPINRHPANPHSKNTDTLKAYAHALTAVGWRKINQGLWLQAQRVGKLIAIQNDLPDEHFPPGCCFIHANVPTVNSFCVKRILEVDLTAASLLLEIYGDEELEEGHIMLPLEVISWFGFPTQAVPVATAFAGFTLPKGAAPVVVPPTE